MESNFQMCAAEIMAETIAIQCELAGWIAENQECHRLGREQAYNDTSFHLKAERLRDFVASKKQHWLDYK